MDFASAQVIGAGLAAIGVGAAAVGVGNVFGSFLESALRNPAAADSQQGRLFIGFAAAELLGSDRIRRGDDHPLRALIARKANAGDYNASDRNFRTSSSRSCSGCWLSSHHLLRHRPGNASEDPGTVELRDKKIGEDLERAQAARAAAEATEAAWRARMDDARAEAARLAQEAKQASAQDTEAKVNAAADKINDRVESASAKIRAAVDSARAEIETVAVDATQRDGRSV